MAIFFIYLIYFLLLASTSTTSETGASPNILKFIILFHVIISSAIYYGG